jgi:hypothetical protein
VSDLVESVGEYDLIDNWRIASLRMLLCIDFRLTVV